MPTQPMKTLTIFCSLLFICIVNACGDPNQLNSEISVASQDDRLTEVQDNYDGKFDRQNKIDYQQKPIQALYLTNYGNFWHNYEAQKNIQIEKHCLAFFQLFLQMPILVHLLVDQVPHLSRKVLSVDFPYQRQHYFVLKTKNI